MCYTSNMEAVDKYRLHGWFLRDHKYLVKPAVLFEGEDPEDFTILLKDSEIEDIFTMEKKGLPCTLQVAFKLRLEEGKAPGSDFLQTRKYVKMPLAEYAKMKGFYITLEDGEVELNPYYEGNKH